MLFQIGIVLIGIGGIGNCVAAWLEHKTGEPIYMSMMKVFSALVGVGGGLCALATIT